MALKPVQDPALLAALNGPDTAAPAGPKPVTDPALLAALNAPETPSLENYVPHIGETPPPSPAPAAPAEEPSLWDRVKTAQTGDPIIDMWLSGLGTAAKGAPEVALNAVNNTAAQAVAGITAPFVSSSDDDSANYIRDFTAENSRAPQGDSAKELTGALGEAFQPLQNIKSKLGDTTLEATGSPGLATTADMLPDLAMAMFGGPKAGVGEIAEAPVASGATRYRMPERPTDMTAPGADLSGGFKPVQDAVNPKVSDLRAADIRLRPSDVRAMTPGAKKVPGEFREKFANAPALKKDLTLHNQQRLTDLNAEDIGVKTLDPASLEKAKEAPAAVYEMAEKVLMDRPMSQEFQDTFREAAASAKLPKGEALGVTRVIGALRRRAAKRLQNNDVATEEAGYADRDLADKLEEHFGKELEAAGEPQLLKEYQDARQQFAKIHDIESTTRAGQIDANAVYKLGKRVPLTGALKLTADAAEHAPNVTGHSLKTAARAGGEIESSKEGITKSLVKSVIRKIPGVDVGTERFQRTLGVPDEARTSYYGKPSDIAPPRNPEQGGLDLREAMDLQAPPGEVGAPQRAPQALGAQTDMLGSAFEFAAPPGEVGIPPQPQISLQDLLGLGEPLTMKPSPGRVGKPKRKS